MQTDTRGLFSCTELSHQSQGSTLQQAEYELSPKHHNLGLKWMLTLSPRHVRSLIRAELHSPALSSAGGFLSHACHEGWLKAAGRCDRRRPCSSTAGSLYELQKPWCISDAPRTRFPSPFCSGPHFLFPLLCTVFWVPVAPFNHKTDGL